jgi:hypothetical protein
MTKPNQKTIFIVLCVIGLLQILYMISKEDIFSLLKNEYFATNNLSTHDKIERVYYMTSPMWFYNEKDMAQYSAYIIKNGNKSWLESMVYVFHEGIFKVEDYTCRIKLIDTGEIIEKTPKEMFSAYYYPIKKVVVSLSDDERLRTNAIAIAILRVNNQTRNDPKRFVNYQLPEIVTVEDPRRKEMGRCIAYVRMFKDMHKLYLKMQRKFGIAKIILHDATPTQNMTEFIKNNTEYGEFVRVQSYDLNPERICRMSAKPLFNGVHTNETYLVSFLQNCLNYMTKQVCRMTLEHEELSLQDCWSQLGYIYEFVAVYDLDEFVFPRSVKPWQQYNQIMSSPDNCDAKRKCKENPFPLSLYDYVVGILNTTIHANSYSRLSSIEFRHAITVLPNTLGNLMIKKFKDLVLQLETNKSIALPLVYDIDDTISLRIQQNDTDHLKYLIKLDDEIQCIFAKLNSSSIIPVELKRYMYHVFPEDWRWGKCIHYSKNVQSLFAHYGIYNKGETVLSNVTNGELLPHFRDDVTPFYKPHPRDNRLITSIQALSIDHEYLTFMTKTYTNMCSDSAR